MAAPSGHKQRALTGQEIQRATGVIAFAFILSGLLGVVRQAIIGAHFGAGSELDAFYAAYRLPEMLFTLVAGGALGSAFIPVFSRYLGNDDLEGAWRLASAVMTLVAVTATLLAIVAAVFGQWLTAHILIPESPAPQQALTASLMQIMLSTVVIFSVSGLAMGILNANQHFLTPALAPSMNNVGLIIGALFLAPRFGVYGLAAGAVLGALLHLGIQIPALFVIKSRLRFLPDLQVPGVKEVLWLMGPRVLGSAVVQVNFLVNTALTSGMTPGSYTALTAGFNLMFTVLGVLGQSVGTAVFPSLAALNAQGDQDGFRRTLSGAIRGVLFLSIPATVGMIVLASPLVATIYQRGRWSAGDTAATAWALQFFALGLVGFALQEVLARAFYALHDTITPVTIAVGGMILNVILSLLLIHVIQGYSDPFGVALNPLYVFGLPQHPLFAPGLWISSAGQGPFGGLALANSLATMIESAVLWIMLRRRLQSLHERAILTMCLQVSLASLAMGLVIGILSGRIADAPAPTIMVVCSAAGLIVFEIAALILNVPEARSVPDVVLRRFRRVAR